MMHETGSISQKLNTNNQSYVTYLINKLVLQIHNIQTLFVHRFTFFQFRLLFINLALAA